jgi:2-methylcitrate dehydratase PrpD
VGARRLPRFDLQQGTLPALIAGTAGHALDYDDVALSGHPSAALTAAILAQGHAQGASGRDCLRAYIVGYEVWAELASREPDPYHIKGWHPTAVFGAVAATAALAHLRGFEAPVAARALAIGASLASGLVANFGTMTKPLHAGRVAAQAFEAVTLAGLGLTAADDALEHHAGFLAALSPRGQVDRERPYRPGEPRILATGLSIKKYPVCYSGHRIIDAVIDIAREADLDAAQVVRVRVGIGRAQASMLRNAAPVTALEAKFSAQFAVAAALLRRKVGLSELDDAFVNEPAMRALYGKVEIGIVEAPDPEDSAFSRYDTVEIEMRDGRVLRSGEVRYPRGHAHLPLAEADLRAKFEDCLAVWRRQAGGDASSLPSAGALYDRLASLAQIDDVRTLFRG